jgi:hypothetical protein
MWKVRQLMKSYLLSVGRVFENEQTVKILDWNLEDEKGKLNEKK